MTVLRLLSLLRSLLPLPSSSRADLVVRRNPKDTALEYGPSLPLQIPLNRCPTASSVYMLAIEEDWDITLRNVDLSRNVSRNQCS